MRGIEVKMVVKETCMCQGRMLRSAHHREDDPDEGEDVEVGLQARHVEGARLEVVRKKDAHQDGHAVCAAAHAAVKYTLSK